MSMELTATGARLEYDCAAGVIEEPLLPDEEGRFTATGAHTPGRGGPIREGDVLPAFRARYDGQVKSAQMDLRVTLTETGVELGQFKLQRGSSGVLFRCL